MTTGIDLILTPTPGTSVVAAADEIGSLTAPIHTPSLLAADGTVYFDQFFAPSLPSVGVTATWTGLTPGQRYNVYVMAVEHFGKSFTGDPWIVNQTVTITGAGTDDPPPFLQNSTAKQRQLLVNDEEGDDTRPLESYAKAVTADASGEIQIEIRRDDGSDANRVILSALAIQEIPPPPPVERDFGDAPDSAATPRYPTLLANGGPSHVLGPLLLGDTIDFESDGQPDDAAGQGSAGGDDGLGSGIDDEDGVAGISSVIAVSGSPTTASLLVVASQTGKLDAWIDFNQNDTFDDPAEHLAGGTSIDVVAGGNIVSFTAPAGGVPGSTFARFRISSAGDLLPTGPAPDGEVEDYPITILDGDAVAGAAAVIDAPSPGNFEIVAEGAQLVVRTGSKDLLRVPGSALASLDFAGTNGDDVLSVASLAGVFGGPVRGNGRGGTDELILTGSGRSLDLTTIPDADLQDFEVVNIVGSGNNSLTLNVTEVLGLSTSTNSILVKSNGGDTVQIGAGWTLAGTAVEDGRFVRRLTQGDATLRLAGPRDWTNPVRTLDVNRNTTIEPQDVLVIINELNNPRFSDASRRLVDAASLATFPGFFYDTASDGFVVPQDALIIINFLNSGAPEGEGADRALPGWGAARWVVAFSAAEVRETIAPPYLSRSSRLSTAPVGVCGPCPLDALPPHVPGRREFDSRQPVSDDDLLDHDRDLHELIELLVWDGWHT